MKKFALTALAALFSGCFLDSGNYPSAGAGGNTGGSGGSGGVATASGGASNSGTGGSATSSGENTGGTSGSTGGGGMAGAGGMAGSGGMTTSTGGSSSGGMAGSGGSGGTGGMTTTTSMSGSCDNGVLVTPDANTDMKSADVNGGVAKSITNGSACWVPSGPGDKFVVSYAYGMSPCNGQTVAASAVAGPNATANCPGGIKQYNDCEVGCIALNTASAMQGKAATPPPSVQYGDALLTCNGQRGAAVYECLAQQAKQPPQQQ